MDDRPEDKAAEGAPENVEWLATLNLPAQYVNRFSFGVDENVVRIAFGTCHVPGHMMYQIAVAMPRDVAVELSEKLRGALISTSLRAR